MKEVTPYDDQLLLQRIANGDESAFSDFFYKHAPAVHAFILKLVKQEDVASDLLQEVFIKAWVNRATLPSILQPSAWLYRVASNIGINYIRRKQLELGWLRELRAEKNISENNTENQLMSQESLRLINDAVKLLPPQRQRIYQLSREQGLERREIAAALNISEHTVKNQLVIALKFIRAYLAEQGGPYLPLVLFTGKIFLP